MQRNRSLVVPWADGELPAGVACDKVLNMLIALEGSKLAETLEILKPLMVFGVFALWDAGRNGLPGAKANVLLQQFSLVLNPQQKSIL